MRRRCVREASARTQHESNALRRTFRFVLVVRGADLARDCFPLRIAELRQAGEVPGTAKMSRAVDRDRLAGEIFAAIGHQERREVREFYHLAVATHRNASADFAEFVAAAGFGRE